MIKIREIKVIPKSVIKRLTDHSRMEFERAGDLAQRIVRHSDKTWLITFNGKPMFVAGVVRTSLIGNAPELWMLLCKDFEASLRDAVCMTKDLRRRLFELYPRLRIKVPLTYEAGHRFAKFFRFQPVTFFENGERQFTIYEGTNGI